MKGSVLPLELKLSWLISPLFYVHIWTPSPKNGGFCDSDWGTMTGSFAQKRELGESGGMGGHVLTLHRLVTSAETTVLHRVHATIHLFLQTMLTYWLFLNLREMQTHICIRAGWEVQRGSQWNCTTVFFKLENEINWKLQDIRGSEMVQFVTTTYSI